MKQVAKAVKTEQKHIRAAISNVGRDLPSGKAFKMLLGGRGHYRKTFRHRQGNNQYLDVVGRSLLPAVILSSPAQGDMLLNLPLNAHLMRAAALDHIAQLYEQESVQGLSIHAPPAGATTDASVHVMMVDRDPADGVPSGQAAIDYAINHNGVMFATREGGILNVPRAKLKGWRFIDATDGSPSDKRLTQSGVFRLFCETGASSSATLALWMSYHLRFKERSIDPETSTSGPGPSLSLENSTAASLSTANPFGFAVSGLDFDHSELKNAGFPVHLGWDGSGSIIQLRALELGIRPDFLMVAAYVSGTATGGAWTLTQSGTSTHAAYETSSGTNTAARCNFYLFTLNAPATSGSLIAGNVVNDCRGGVLNPARLVTTADVLSAANPGWEIRFSIGTFTTPTSARVHILPLRGNGSLSYSIFGPGTLQHAAVRQAAESKEERPITDIMRDLQRQQDDKVLVLQARLADALRAIDEKQQSGDGWRRRPSLDDAPPSPRAPTSSTSDGYVLARLDECKETPRHSKHLTGLPQPRAGLRP